MHITSVMGVVNLNDFAISQKDSILKEFVLLTSAMEFPSV